MSILFCFTKAWLIGFAIAAPIGPIGMLCIKKTLEFGFAGTIGVAIGASCADSIYGTIAALGLSSISNFLINQILWIKIIGGILLLYLAYYELKKNCIILNNNKNYTECNIVTRKLPITVFFLTLTNPMTILTFIGIFSSLTIKQLTFVESIMTIIGIFSGTMSWWLTLGCIIINLQKRISDTWISRIRYISVSILAGFGFFSLFGAIIGSIK